MSKPLLRSQTRFKTHPASRRPTRHGNTIAGHFAGSLTPPDESKFAPFEATSPAAGVSPSTGLGYDVQATRMSDDRRAKALQRCNATLTDKKEFIDFFCTDITIDISLAGGTGQGIRARDFYPHNMVLPGYKVTGICIDQDHYGELCEFIHKSQQTAVHNGDSLTLNLDPGFSFAHERFSGSSTRGGHIGIVAKGYVMSIPRHHERFVYAPTFTFEFMVVTNVEGVYKEDAAINHEQANFAALVSDLKNNPTVNPTFGSDRSLSKAQQAQISSYDPHANTSVQTGD